jgi:hypothetical protein
MYTATATHECWLWPVKFAVKLSKGLWVADNSHYDMHLLSSSAANILLGHFSRKMKDHFIAESKVVTKCLLSFKCSIMSSQNAFHYISSSVSCCVWTEVVFLDISHTVCCGIQSLPTGLNNRLLQTSHKCLNYVINSFCANVQPASAFTDTSFMYKLPIPTSDRVSYVVLKHCWILFVDLVLGICRQHFAFFHFRCHFPLKVTGVSLPAGMLQLVFRVNSLLFFRLLHVFIWHHFKLH